LVCDQPWESNGPGYTTVFNDSGIYRMYYHTNPRGRGNDNDETQVTCYAESKNGINWYKPNIGLYEFNDSKENNIIWKGVLSHNFTPFIDNNPDCLVNQRYKAIGGVKWGSDGLWLLSSQDAINWQKNGEKPLLIEGNFDSQNIIFWDNMQMVYRAFWRDHRWNDPIVPDGRDIKTAISKDFLSWSESDFLVYRPNRSGSNEFDIGDDPTGDHHQFYTNNIQAYYRAPHLMFGFPTGYHDRGWTPSTDALPDRERRRELANKGVKGGHPTRLGTALTDTRFIVSRDGKEFYVWPEAFIRPGIQRHGSWFYGQGSCAWGMLQTQSTFVDSPPEISFYVHDNASVEGPKHLRRYSLRLDGFTSIYAPLTGGSVVTKPFTFQGKCLEINFSTSAAGRLRIEFQDDRGNPITGYTLEDCDLQYGDQIDRVVTWNSKSDVSELVGRSVRLRFELKDADVFAFQFKEGYETENKK